MRKVNPPIFILLFTLQGLVTFSQELTTIIDEDFTIRDFKVDNDSVFYIKKRDIHFYSKNTKTSDEVFLGGYGIKFFKPPNSNIVIIASNELKNLVSSVRVFNSATKELIGVFYYKKGKILDVVNIPEDKIIVVSTTDNKIIFLDYRNPRKIFSTFELNINSLSRKLIYKNNNLFFCTDVGSIETYNILLHKVELIYKGKDLITSFSIDNNELILATNEERIIKVNILNKEQLGLTINNTFVSTMIKFNDTTLICGTWDGRIIIIDTDRFIIKEELRHHKRAILQIKKGKNNTLYSSGIDKKIKKWKLK